LAFDALIEAGGSWLSWIEGASHFESILKERIPWGDLDPKDRKIVEKRLGTTSPGNQLLLNSFYVTMVAGFEEFLRATIRELVTEISGRGFGYDQIDKVILRINLRESAKLLRRVDSPPDHIAFSEGELCRGIGSCAPGSTKVELNAVAFAEIESLIRLDNFFDRAVALGKRKLTWDYIGGQQVVKQAMKIKSEGPRQVGKQVSIELTRVATYRNRIAHMGGHAAEVTLQVLQDDRELLKALVSVIDSA
jgi:hypothetical protein